MMRKFLICILSVALVGIVFIVNLHSSTNTSSLLTTSGLEQKGTVVDSILKSRLLGGEHLFSHKGNRNNHRDDWEDDDERYTDRHKSKRSNKHGFTWEDDDDWSHGKKQHKKYQKGGRYIGHVDHHHKRKNHDKYNDDDDDERHHRGKRYTDDYNHHGRDYMDDYIIYDDDYRPRSKHGKKDGKKGDKKKSMKGYYGWRK